MKVLITGLGFISSHVIRHFVESGHDVTVATRNTYAAKFKGVHDILADINVLIGDLAEMHFARQCAATQPEWVIHMAAETHVDRAIEDPQCFIRSNVLGTTNLLQALWEIGGQPAYGNHHANKIIVYSTDEVFGSTPEGQCFDEQAPYNPSNAYSASKVGVEAIANSFWVTHQMPTIVVRPCNTYGPGQHPEKVIPKFVGQMLRGEPITVYNDGKGARDWLHVDDHAKAIHAICENGEPGESYNLAAGEEHNDMDIALRIQQTLIGNGYIGPTSLDSMIKLTPGRPGHDRRYWMDNTKLSLLGWGPVKPFWRGFTDTVIWTAENQDYWDSDVVKVGYAAD